MSLDDFIHTTQYACEDELTLERVQRSTRYQIFGRVHVIAAHIDRDFVSSCIWTRIHQGTTNFCDEHGLLAFSYEEPLVLVWIDDNLRTTPSPTESAGIATMTTR